MEIKIYQINMERDTERMAFESLARLEKFHGSHEINSGIYDKVYEGAVDSASLEDVFTRFNLYRPEGYTGRALAVSDVIQVVDAMKVAPGFYFRDSDGFQEVQFHPELTQNQSKMIRAILLEPDNPARVIEINVDVGETDQLIGGNMEAWRPFSEDIAVVYNSAAKAEGQRPCRAIRTEDKITEMSYQEMVRQFRKAESDMLGHITGYIVFTEDSFSRPYSERSRTYVVSSDNKAYRPNMGGYSIYGACLDGSDPCVRLEKYMAAEQGGTDGWRVEKCYTKETGREILDVVYGTCLLCGNSDGQLASLTQDQIDRYMEKYKSPEQIIPINGNIVAIPMDLQTTREDRDEAAR